MNKTKFGFGSSSDVENAILGGKLNARDVLFLDENTDNPKIGWIKKDGTPVILTDEKADLTELEADVAKLEKELAAKANAEEVNAKIGKAVEDTVATANAYTNKVVEAAMDEHLTKKYEFTDVPAGTLVDYRDSEIRVMCPTHCQWTKQNVGIGGDPNCYYATFKTYVPSDDVVGYKEHLGSQSDTEILTDFHIDEFGRRYQPTWLALAKYDETTDTWTYYGKNSTNEKMTGWDYQIDWFNADGVMIASDSIRISLSNEACHYNNKPYYVGAIEKQIEEKIAEVESAYEIIEF